MIGALPVSVTVDGAEYEIRTDYRNILLLLEAMADEALSEKEKWLAALNIFYQEKCPDHAEEAIKQLVWFLNGGKPETETHHKKPIFSWNQDEQLIFAAVNKVSGREVRAVEYMHWWTFLALFQEVGESLFSQVVNIRVKKNRSEKLDKSEQRFYRENKSTVDLKRKYSAAEQRTMNAVNEMLGL